MTASPLRQALSPSPSAWALSRAGNLGVTRGLSRVDFLRRNRFIRLLSLACLRLCRRRVPVPRDLDCKNEVEREASEEAVQDERIVDFLDSCEDAGQRAQEEVDHLYPSKVSNLVVCGTLEMDEEREKDLRQRRSTGRSHPPARS